MSRKFFGFVIFVFLVASVSAQYYSSGSSFSYSSPQYTSSSFYGVYPSDLDSADCEARQDFLIQIAPGGCTPAVVRSDLLSQQDVHVFCQLQAIQLNPLIEASSIRNIVLSHEGSLPEGVRGVSFYRPNAAYSYTENSNGFLTLDNLGYAVIILRQQPDERNMTESFNGTISAQISYDALNFVGMGVNEIVSPALSDEEWSQTYPKYSFLDGMFYLRVESVNGDSARVSIYRDENYLVDSFVLRRGETSSERYLPGFDCNAKYSLTFVDGVSPQTTAKIVFNGDEYSVYAGSSFAEGVCRVTSIRPDGFGGGTVTGSCNGEPFNLKLNYKPVVLSIGGVETSYSVGDEIKDGLFVVGVGVDVTNNEFALLYNGELTEDVMKKVNKEKVKAMRGEDLEDKFIVLKKDESYTDVSLMSYIENDDKASENIEFEENFQNAMDNYNLVEENFGDKERIDGGVESYGVVALKEAFQIAVNSEKYLTASQIAQKLRNDYGVDVTFSEFDFSNAYDVVETGDMFYTISLESVNELDDSEYGVITSVDDVAKPSLGVGDSVFVDGSNSAKISSFRKDSVSFEIDCDGKLSTKIVDIGEQAEICGKLVRVKMINYEEFAKIKFNSGSYVGGDVEFNYNLFVEKRAFELTPQKAMQRISKLNETIRKWEQINSKLGDVVSGMKAACFATSAALQVKNLFGGLGGEAIARNEVMTDKENGWNAICQRAVSNGGYPPKEDVDNFGIKEEAYSSVDDCIMLNKDAIEDDVDLMARVIREYNDAVDDRTRGIAKSGGLFGGSFVDPDEALQKSIEEIQQDFSAYSYPLDKISEYSEKGFLSSEDVKEIEVNLRVLEEEPDNYLAKSKLDEVFGQAEGFANAESVVGNLRNVAGVGDVGHSVVDVGGRVLVYDGHKTSEAVAGKVEKGEAVTTLTIGASTYFVVLNNVKDDNYAVDRDDVDLRIYEVNSNGGIGDRVGDEKVTVGDNEIAVKDYIGSFQFVRSGEGVFNNRILDPEVLYYEVEPYKGMPAIVPVDIRNGWYAATVPPLLSGASGTFQDSGSVSNFWVGNVGPNGKVEFQTGGDDLYQSFTVGQSVDSLLGLSASQSQEIVNEAKRRLEEAASAYRSGVREIRLGGTNVDVGDPAVAISGTKCTDFMSANDCSLMFNVCDPVICPASRCNLGGKFYVSDVIQSGVVGSMFLCLPNFGSPSEGGVLVPVCLSGVHAGIDNYISIMKAYQDCLQENIDNGNYVGICDQISAIYECEFFWRQFAPLINSIVPTALDFLTGHRGIRGGGEYMVVQSAWDNMQESIDYFKNTYAVNAIKAFEVRSTEEVGTEVCKSFISFRYANDFKTLIEPDSPVQFSVWFSEIEMTTATIPATSQYKVYFHIFAGNDVGTYYNVYLKNRDGESYYISSDVASIATGYIPKGEYVDDSMTFTAPAGFKEVCVRVNGQDNCGFKQVSTDFALNYLKDTYTEQQVQNTDIQTEDECISGTPNALALINPDIQSGAEEAANPEIYKRGIIRVCATANPGASTESDRWVKVGVCGNSGADCWLDTQSVGDAITSGNVGAVNETMDILNDLVEEQQLSEDGKVVGVYADVNKEILAVNSEVKNFEKRDDLLSDLQEIENKYILVESQQAMVDLVKARIYTTAANKFWDDVINARAEGRKDDVPAEEPESPETPADEPEEPVVEVDDRKDVSYDFEVRTVDEVSEAINYAKENSLVDRTCSCGDDCYSYAQLLVEAQNDYKIPDALLLLSLMMQESSCVRTKCSDSSCGLMQINLKYWCGKNGLPVDKADCKSTLLTNVEKNIDTGAHVLKYNYGEYKNGKQFSGACNESYQNVKYYEWEAAVRGYNGWGCNMDYTSQDRFVTEVMDRYELLANI